MHSMQTIELSQEVKPNQPLVVPFDLLNQHVGTQAKIIVVFEPHHIQHQPTANDDATWDEIVQRIQSEPIPSDYIIPATEVFTAAMVDELLAGEDELDFDAAAWDAQWDAYEAEMKQRTREKEQAFLDDMAKSQK